MLTQETAQAEEQTTKAAQEKAFDREIRGREHTTFYDPDTGLVVSSVNIVGKGVNERIYLNLYSGIAPDGNAPFRMQQQEALVLEELLAKGEKEILITKDLFGSLQKLTITLEGDALVLSDQLGRELKLPRLADDARDGLLERVAQFEMLPIVYVPKYVAKIEDNFLMVAPLKYNPNEAPFRDYDALPPRKIFFGKPGQMVDIGGYSSDLSRIDHKVDATQLGHVKPVLTDSLIMGLRDKNTLRVEFWDREALELNNFPQLVSDQLLGQTVEFKGMSGTREEIQKFIDSLGIDFGEDHLLEIPEQNAEQDRLDEREAAPEKVEAEIDLATIQMQPQPLAPDLNLSDVSAVSAFIVTVWAVKLFGQTRSR